MQRKKNSKEIQNFIWSLCTILCQQLDNLFKMGNCLETQNRPRLNEKKKSEIWVDL